MATVELTLKRNAQGYPELVVDQKREPDETGQEHEDGHRKTLRALGTKNAVRDAVLDSNPTDEGNNPVGTRKGITQ